MTGVAKVGGLDNGEVLAVKERAARAEDCAAQAHLTSGVSGERSESAARRG